MEAKIKIYPERYTYVDLGLTIKRLSQAQRFSRE